MAMPIVRSTLVLCAALLLSSCGNKVPAMEMHEIQGPAGLSLAIPRGYASKSEADTLRVYLPERERSRSPVDITVWLAAAAPEWPRTEQKELAGRDVHYLIVEEEGGSGGSLLRLKAWVESNGRFVLLQSVVQPESGGDGEFRAEWAILPTLRHTVQKL